MKSILCCLLCVLLLLSPLSVQAEEAPADEELTELEALLMESMDQNEPVDVSQYELTREELFEIYDHLLNTGHFPWDADGYFDYVSNTSGHVATFRPRLLRHTRYDEKKYEQKMAELIAQVCVDGMEPWQLALNCHEYIISRCKYSYLDTTNNGYHALLGGQSACYGYARLYLEVMQRIGIPCKIVDAKDAFDGLGHAWNVVQLYGNWYHVDLTWDDPLFTSHGITDHEHFLKSDNQFHTEANGHNFDWDVDVECKGGTYSTQPVWRNVSSRILFPDASTMILRRISDRKILLYSVDCSTMEETLIYSEDIPPVTGPGGQYLCNTYGMSLYEGRVYTQNPKEVYSLLPDGSDRRTEYEFDTSAGQFIVGTHVQEGTLFVELSDLDSNFKVTEVSLDIQPSHTHNYASTTQAPTCAEAGFTNWLCDCGLSFQTERKDPIAHEMTEQLLEENGTEILRQSCRACGYTVDTAPDTSPSATMPNFSPAETSPNNATVASPSGNTSDATSGSLRESPASSGDENGDSSPLLHSTLLYPFLLIGLLLMGAILCCLLLRHKKTQIKP